MDKNIIVVTRIKGEKDCVIPLIEGYLDNSGISVKVGRVSENRNLDGDSVYTLVELTLGFTSGVIGGVVANRIYDALKNVGADKLSINHAKTSVDLDEIKKALREVLEERSVDNE